MTSDDLRKRLQRLGVTKGGDFSAKPRPENVATIETLLNGQVRENRAGEFYEVIHTYPLAALRGSAQLGEWLAIDPSSLSLIGNLDITLPADLSRFLFLDTETTGLGGAGAIVFMVGIAYFTPNNEFEVRQFFLRHPAEEQAMLTTLTDYLVPDTPLVTFNGRSFDVPMVAGRYLLSRLPTSISRLTNLDLLFPARRLWGRRLPSCALSALEADILGIRREQRDVPGALIPLLYQQYVTTGDAREMARVFYHNEQDILSMVALGCILARAFSRPDAPAVPVEDRISLARWYENQSMHTESEIAYRLALDEAPDAETRYEALLNFGALLKRLDRRPEAVPLWEDLADLKLDVVGHEELAKHYEWHVADWEAALHWTESGIRVAESWRPGFRQMQALATLRHRHARLLRKLAGKSANELSATPED